MKIIVKHMLKLQLILCSEILCILVTEFKLEDTDNGVLILLLKKIIILFNISNIISLFLKNLIDGLKMVMVTLIIIIVW